MEMEDWTVLDGHPEPEPEPALVPPPTHNQPYSLLLYHTPPQLGIHVAAWGTQHHPELQDALNLNLNLLLYHPTPAQLAPT